MGIRSTQVGLRWFQALGKPPQTKRQINGATFARINSNADILRECPENRAASATAPSTLIFSLAAKRERLAPSDPKGTKRRRNPHAYDDLIRNNRAIRRSWRRRGLCRHGRPMRSWPLTSTPRRRQRLSLAQRPSQAMEARVSSARTATPPPSRAIR